MARVSRFTGKVVIGKVVDELGIGFAGDGLQHVTGEHLRTEHGRQSQFFHLIDQFGHLSNRRLREIRRLYRADDFHAVLLGKVSPGIVVGQQLAVLFRHGGHCGPDRLVHLFDFATEYFQVPGVICGVVRVKRRQSGLHQLGVAQTQVRVRPEMRIGMARRFREGEIELPLIGSNRPVAQGQDHGIVFLVGLGQSQCRFLQKQPIDDYQVGAGHELGHGRGWLKGVGIHAFGHHALQADPRAADIFDDTGDWRNGGDDLKSCVLPVRVLRCVF